MFRKILVIFIGVLAIHICSGANSPMKLIINTDAGGDDAVAILLTLAAREEAQVIAITCSYGNTYEAIVETNVLKILTVANRSDIPVYGGAKKSLLQNYTACDYFGKDGFGDFKFDRHILGSVDKSKHAAIAMIELAKQHSGDISILSIGPLTNIALAASLDSNFMRNINRFYVMGSTINEPEHGLKNPKTEFNFRSDPESAAIFLNLSMKASIVTPWDVVKKNSIPKEWRTQVLGKLNSEAISFLNKVENVVLDRSNDWTASDAIAAATMLWPELVTSSLEAHMTSVTCGPFRGSVLIESDNLSSEDKNVDIIRDFSVTAYKDKLLKYLA